ncbi:MAG: hypothetical protein WCO84_00550 [bacterium]
MILEEVFNQGIQSAYQVLSDMFPYLFPAVLILFAWKFWRYYIIHDFLSKQEFVVLEVKLPKEHQKTPHAMELVLGAFYQFPVPPTWYDYYWVGKVPLPYSLEMVSIEGNVHFYLRVSKKDTSVIENHIYSQYPQAEVHLVPDYVGGVPYSIEGNNWKIHGMEHILARDDAYPIKTYLDYGIDRELLKEEQKVDPITSTIEFLGSIGKGEQVWLQIMVMAAQPRFKKAGTWFGMEDWKGNAKAAIAKILPKDKTVVQLSPGDKTVLEAIERSIGKIGFDCGIRTLYLAEKDKFKPGNIGSLFACFRQYGTVNLNSFKPSRNTSTNWWQDWFGWKEVRLKKEIFKAYVNRGYFYHPYKASPIFTLNTEELATIYHFPGAVSVTPTFTRIESKKAEAPINLPI